MIKKEGIVIFPDSDFSCNVFISDRVRDPRGHRAGNVHRRPQEPDAQDVECRRMGGRVLQECRLHPQGGRRRVCERPFAYESPPKHLGNPAKYFDNPPEQLGNPAKRPALHTGPAPRGSKTSEVPLAQVVYLQVSIFFSYLLLHECSALISPPT